MRKSKTLEKLRSGRVARICCLYSPMSMYPAHAARAGYDGIWLDAEHNTWDVREVQRMIGLHRLADIDCIVRPPSRNRIQLYHLLEMGATGMLVPMVSTENEARDLVDSLKFPPLGERGLDGAGLDNNFYLDGTAGYPERANGETLIAVQIETPEALENVEAIAAVPGIDVLFIGPGDLALRLGCALDWSEPQMSAAEDRVAAAARKAGIFWGRPSGLVEDMKRLLKKGARFIAHGSDFESVAFSMARRYRENFEESLTRSGLD